MTKPTDEQLTRFVQQNVHLCLSAMVATLANGNGLIGHGDGATDLASLCEQAAELTAPTEDYSEAARENGWTESPEGWWWREPRQDELEDGAADFYFLGSGPYMKATDADDACNIDGCDPYQREIYEHWAVNEWLAEKLEAKGERVDRDFAGLCVWGRTCTGQAISMDGVIEAIWIEANA
jgi:hypothetical protein